MDETPTTAETPSLERWYDPRIVTLLQRSCFAALLLTALAGFSFSVGGDVEACSCSYPNPASERSPLISGTPVPIDAQPWFLARSCSSDPPCSLLTYDAGAAERLPGKVDCVRIIARIIADEPLTPGASYSSDCDPYVDRGDGIQGRADALTVRGDTEPSLPPLTLVSASAHVERVDSCCGGDAKLIIDVEFAEDDATVSRFFGESGLIEAKYESTDRVFVIPAAPDEREFWERDRGTDPEVSDITLTPVSANALRGTPMTIAGDSIAVDPVYTPCSIGQERSPLLLLAVFAIAWRRRPSRTGG